MTSSPCLEKIRIERQNIFLPYRLRLSIDWAALFYCQKLNCQINTVLQEELIIVFEFRKPALKDGL